MILGFLAAMGFSIASILFFMATELVAIRRELRRISDAAEKELGS